MAKLNKKPVPRFTIGVAVWVMIVGHEGHPHIISGYKWNGLTYMYSFKDSNLMCGEEYLKSIR